MQNKKENFRQVQYVTVKDPTLGILQGRPSRFSTQAGGKKTVFPVLSWGLTEDDKLESVLIQIEPPKRIGDAPVTKWLHISRVNLFLSSAKQPISISLNRYYYSEL